MTNKSKTIQTSGKPQIVFFGSGPVSAKSLELLRQDFVIEAVVTKPTTLNEMKTVADGALVHAVSNKTDLDELINTDPFDSQIAVLIDFGILVSQKVIDYFPLGIVNSHFSLLPNLRGADPITFAILSGQKKTGVSLMLLVEAMDEGPVIACGVYKLDGTETNPELTERLIFLSHELLKAELPRYISGDAKAVDQSKLSDLVPDYPTQPSYSRKLTKQDGILNFTKSAEQLEREIRAFIDWPKSRTRLSDKDIIVTKAHVQNSQGESGKVVVDNKTLRIHCGRNTLVIDRLKPAGKNEMTAEAFLAGHKDLLR